MLARRAEPDCLDYGAIRMGRASGATNLVTLHMAGLCAQQDAQLAYMPASSEQVNGANRLWFLFPFE